MNISDSLLFCFTAHRKSSCLYLLCLGFIVHQYGSLCLVIEANRMNAFFGFVYFEIQSHHEVMGAGFVDQAGPELEVVPLPLCSGIAGVHHRICLYLIHYFMHVLTLVLSLESL